MQVIESRWWWTMLLKVARYDSSKTRAAYVAVKSGGDGETLSEAFAWEVL